MQKIEWMSDVKVGSRIYNARTKKTGTYIGQTDSISNYNIYLIKYDGNKNPSRVNWIDAKQLGYDHLYLLEEDK